MKNGEELGSKPRMMSDGYEVYVDVGVYPDSVCCPSGMSTQDYLPTHHCGLTTSGVGSTQGRSPIVYLSPLSIKKLRVRDGLA